MHNDHSRRMEDALRTEQATNEHGVTYTKIFLDDKHVANCYRTFHPTIPYEVFWDNGRRSKRCNSVLEACEIVAEEIVKQLTAFP